METAKKVILIIDDDEDFLYEMGETLHLSGYPAYTFSKSDQVLPFLREKIDVAFVDLKMEGTDGLQLVGRMRKHPLTREARIFCITGFYTQEECKQLLSNYLVEDFLIKPLRPLDIITCIEQVRAVHNW